MVGLAMVLVMNVSHVSSVSVMIRMIMDSLNAPVWKMNLVDSLCYFPIRVLLMAKVRPVVLVMNMIFEVVWLGMVVVVVLVVVIMMVMYIMVMIVRVCQSHSTN